MEPWGISGPDFAVIYSLAVWVTGPLTYFVGRLVLLRSPWAQYRPDRLTVEEVAYLVAGRRVRGRRRAIAAVVAELVVRNQLRVSRSGQLTATGAGRGRTRLESAVIEEVNRRPGQSLDAYLGGDWAEPVFDEVRAALVRRGLWVSGPRRKVLLVALPLILLAGLGTARLVNGIGLDRPVGELSYVLAVNVIFVVLALLPLRPERTKVGDAVVADMGTRRITSNPALGAGVLVAVGGMALFPDAAIAQAFRDAPVSSGLADGATSNPGSSSGSDSSGSGGSSCGSGCGGSCGG